MSDLVLAAFASETGAHLVREPRDAPIRGIPAALRRGSLPRSTGGGRAPLARRGPTRRFRRCCGRFTIHRAGLFLRGAADAEVLSEPAVAIVGARACSAYGAGVARSLGRELAAAGLVVVSGLARGIDGGSPPRRPRVVGSHGGRSRLRHRPGLSGCAPRARTEDLRAGPRDLRVRPRASSPLHGGSRLATGIIAGVSVATIVVEARERSGSLITADLALEEGREVFAVPGEITSGLSRGTNALLRLGATPLTAATDVLEAFGHRAACRRASARLAGCSEACSPRSTRVPRPPTSSSRVRLSTRAPLRRRSPSSSWPGSSRAATGVYRQVMPAS